ncbi:DUF4184 family protein [Kitasatospora sp. NBC_01539]|uniref:DUF4184 family protein n=1 Tax=Kitasatospora sp. NBC_01539 TaxID=2903577 RepID=UPI00386018F6
MGQPEDGHVTTDEASPVRARPRAAGDGPAAAARAPGPAGRPARPAPADATVRATPLPAGSAPVVDLAGIAGPGTCRLLLTEDGRLTRWESDTGTRRVLATTSVTVPADAAPWDGHLPRLHLHASADGRFAAVVVDHGSAGSAGEVFDLTTGTRTMVLDGGAYLPATVPFALAFAEHEGRTVLVHRAAWNRLDAADPATGRSLTARTIDPDAEGLPAAHDLDYFHGALHVSPGRRTGRSGGVAATGRARPWQGQDGRMPFTLSHAAAVLPALGRPWCRPWTAVGLVAGSMAPDVPFFAASLLPGVYRHGAVTHRWWAVPTVDVVIAAGMAAVWQGLLRAPLTGLLPARLAAAAASTAGAGPVAASGGSVAGLAAGAAVGAATHVVWDSFTHPGRAGVRAVPVLSRPWVAGVPGCTVLQYGTSLVGLAVLAGAAGRTAGTARTGDGALPAVRPGPAARRAATAGLALCTAVGAVHRLRRRERGVVAELCFGAGAGLAVGSVGYALAARAVAGGPAGQGAVPRTRHARGVTAYGCRAVRGPWSRVRGRFAGRHDAEGVVPGRGGRRRV